MDIENQIKNIKEWAIIKGILLIEGVFDEPDDSLVTIDNKDGIGINLFKELVEKLDGQALVFSSLMLNSSTLNYFEEKKEFFDNSIKESLNSIRNFENKYLHYTLYFFNNGMIYKIVDSSPEITFFIQVQEAIQDIDNPPPPTLTPDEIEEYAKELVSNEIYPKIKNRTQREHLALKLFGAELETKKLNVKWSVYSITSEAENHYETIIKPRQERQLKQQIINMHEKRWNKTKIAAELGISIRIVNKYV